MEPVDTGGQLLVRSLAGQGVDTVFGIPGVQLDEAADALHAAADRIRFVCARNEQATTYLADGYARSTGREGVAMVVPGPGVLNALSGLATAYATNSRVLLLAGQIDSRLIGRGTGALHEIPDQTGMLQRLTKWTGGSRRSVTAAATSPATSPIPTTGCSLRRSASTTLARWIPGRWAECCTTRSRRASRH